MADLLKRTHLRELVERRDGPCVSVYLPTHRTLPGSAQDPIQLKNLLRGAEEQLSARGIRATEARRLLEPARALLGLADFWRYQSDGLALFSAPRWWRFLRLPVEFPVRVSVGERFLVAPLVQLLSADQRFYVCALSRNGVRLLEGTRQRVEEVELEDVPQGLRDALRYDDLEKQRLFHVAGRGGRGARAIFHGHGVGGEVDKALLARYLRQVDAGLWEILRDEHAPLVLAGVAYEQAMFRAVTRYPQVLADGIEGNPDELSPAELHAAAWAIVEPYRTRMRREAAGRYREARGHGAGAVADLEDVVRAATGGRIDTLFVAAGEERWGTVDAESGAVTLHPAPQEGDEEFLDLAAAQTLIASGTVYVVPSDDLPGPGPAGALLRY